MATITFYNRNENLYCRLNEGAQNNIRFAAKLRIPAGHTWSNKTQSLTPEHYEFAAQVAAAKAQIASIYSQTQSFEATAQQYAAATVKEEVEVNPESLEILDALNFILSEIKAGRIKTSEKKILSEKSISTYAYAINWVERYSKTTGSVDLAGFNLSAAKTNAQKAKITQRWDAYFAGLDQTLVDGEAAESTRNNVFKILAILLGKVAAKHYLQFPVFYNVPLTDSPVVVFPPTFVQSFLRNTDYASLDQCGKYYYEISTLILTTTLRISDVLRIQPYHINFEQRTFAIRNQKTFAQTNAPLAGKLAEIFQANLQQHGQLFTPCASTGNYFKINEGLRKFFAQFPELQQNHVVEYLLPNGKIEAKVQPLYEYATPHLLRRSSITTMIYLGVRETDIKRLSGHSKSSAAFARYVGYVEANFSQGISDFLSKVF